MSSIHCRTDRYFIVLFVYQEIPLEFPSKQKTLRVNYAQLAIYFAEREDIMNELFGREAARKGWRFLEMRMNKEDGNNAQDKRRINLFYSDHCMDDGVHHDSI